MSQVANDIMFHFWVIFNNSFDAICWKWVFRLRGLEVPHFEVTILSAREAFDAEPSS